MINWTVVWSVLAAIAMAALAPVVLMAAIALIWFIVSIPFFIGGYISDWKKTRELIAKGADPDKFYVKDGIIMQK